MSQKAFSIVINRSLGPKSDGAVVACSKEGGVLSKHSCSQFFVVRSVDDLLGLVSEIGDAYCQVEAHSQKVS